MDNKSEVVQELKCYDFTKKTWRDDVTFLVEDQSFYANKALLALDSPVFEAMFGANFKESEETEIPLLGKRPEDFNEFLHCIYPKTARKIDADNVYTILPLADEFDAKSLLRRCLEYLSSRVKNVETSTEEVTYCHLIATRYNFQRLRDICVSRLSEEGVKDIQSHGCKDTGALLDLHRDLLMRQGELLERTRTELVDVYMKKNLSSETLSDCDLSSVKGTIIKFKPCIKLPHETTKRSKPVSLWNINFQVGVKLTKVEERDHLSVFLEATFPEPDDNRACIIDAMIQMRNDDEEFQHICHSLKEIECSKKTRLNITNELENLYLFDYVKDNHVDIVVYLKVKEPYIKVQ